MKKRVQNVINYVANILFVVSFLLLGFYLLRFVSPDLRLREKQLPDVQLGSAFPKLRELPKQEKHRLLIFADSRCRFSNESLRFFRQLVSEVYKHSAKFDIYLIFPKEDTGAEDVVNELQFPVSFTKANFADLGVDRSPAFIFLDSSSLVVFAYGGMMDEGEQQILLREIH